MKNNACLAPLILMKTIRIWLHRESWTLRLVRYRRVSIRLLHYQLRAHVGRLIPIGSQKNLDAAVNAAMFDLFGITDRDIAEDDRARIASAKLSAGPLVAALASAIQKSEIRDTISFLFSVIYHGSNFGGDVGFAERAEDQLRTHGLMLMPLDQALRNGFATMEDRLAELSEKAKDVATIKIDPTLSGVAGVIGLVSTLFALSGYFYSSMVYGALGIDVSLFFSIGDYLASKHSDIYNAAYLMYIQGS